MERQGRLKKEKGEREVKAARTGGSESGSSFEYDTPSGEREVPVVTGQRT